MGSYSFRVNVVDNFGDSSPSSPAVTIIVAPPFVFVDQVSDVLKKKKVTKIVVTFSGASTRPKPTRPAFTGLLLPARRDHSRPRTRR